MTGATGLINGVNGACSIDGTVFTGCYQMTPSNGGAYQFKIVAKTQSSITSSVLTPIINLTNQSDSHKFRIIAGNVSRSLKENALSSIIVPNRTHQQSMAMDSKGVLYIFDHNIGIVKLDPNKGILEPVLSATGTTAGNGGHHLLATSTKRIKIDVDGLDRLVIWDGTQIRRIDNTTGTITNIAGPGAATGTGVTATTYAVPNVNPGGAGNILRPQFFFKALANGDVVFRSGSITFTTGLYNGGGRIARVVNATGKILEKNITGNIPGFGNTSSIKMDNIDLDFDPVTSEVTFIKGIACPMDAMVSNLNCTGPHRVLTVDPVSWQLTGEVIDQVFRYPMTSPHGTMYGQEDNRVWKYDMNTKTWDALPLAGTGTLGYCKDNTSLVTACDMDVRDAMVSPFGQVYIWDGNLIRVIDPNKKFKTVAGQRLSSGDNGPALSARIAAITSFDILSKPGSTKLVFHEDSEFKLREIILDGVTNNIQHIAGNGKIGTTMTAGVKVLDLPGSMATVKIKPDTEEVFVMRGVRFVKINASDEWERVFLGGAGANFSSPSSNGLAGLNVSLHGSNSPFLLYLDADKAIASIWGYGSPTSQSYLKLYDATDQWRQHNLAGGPYTGGNINTIDQTGSYSQSFYGAGFEKVVGFHHDSVEDEYLFLTNSAGSQKFITRYDLHNTNPGDFDYNDAGDVYSSYTLQHDAVSFVPVKNASNQLVIYYCTTSGLIYKQNITSATAPKLLASNFISIGCGGTKMYLDKNRRSIIFPFQQNSLWGFAEIVDHDDIPAP